MDLQFDELSKLLDRFEAAGYEDIEVRSGDVKIHVRKHVKQSLPAFIPAQGAAAPAGAGAISAPAPSAEGGAARESHAGTPVTAPLVGVFYEAEKPGAEPYAKVGQHVKKGDTIGLIEAMKSMNDIPAPVSGTISEIVVGNEEFTEFGRVLMYITED